MMPRVMRALLRTYGISLIAGVLLAVSFPSWNFYWLAWVAPALLFWRVRRARALEAAAQFFAAGWVFHTILLQWQISNIYWVGGFAVLGYQLLCVLLALFWALTGAVWVHARRQAPRFGNALGLALLWTFLEFFEARLFTGFGWSALGYSQGPNLWLLQLAAVGGVSLISFILALVNALLALAAQEGPWRYRRLAAAAAVVVLAHAGGALLLREAAYPEQPFNVGIIQPAFPQDMKWSGLYDEQMVRESARMSSQLAARAPLDLVVWPEATVMESFDREPYATALRAVARDTQAGLFAGAVRETGRKSFNSSVLLDRSGETAGYYDKVHLAPFGEYMPFSGILPFLRQIVPADVDAGEVQKVLPFEERTLGPLICFEVLFSPMAETLRRMGADTLVVVTNLGWFGRSCAAAQELDIARLRAIETRLPVIHAANTGLSGVFDPYGRFARMYEQYTALQTLAHRCMQVIPLPLPAARPAPWGPRTVPWAFAILAGLWVSAALAWGRWSPDRPRKD